MNKIETVDFGRRNSGRLGLIAYRLINSSGSITTSRTTNGISEVGSGAYLANVVFPNSWDSGIILWDNGGTPRTYAHAVYQRNDVGSIPSYVGSIVWSKNPNNFTSPNTFGQRIDRLMQRASWGVAAVSQTEIVFKKEDKEILFKWLETITQRIKSIELINSKNKGDIVNFIIEKLVSISDLIKKDLADSANTMTALSVGSSKALKQDIAAIFDTMTNLLKFKTKIVSMHEDLKTLKKELGGIAKKEEISELIANSDRTGEVKALVGNAIECTAVIKKSIDKILKFNEDQIESNIMIDKVLLKLLPEDKLIEVFSEVTQKNNG